jgi:hypothetical protein
MLVHARRLLKDRVDAKTLAMWDEHLKAIVPEQIYRDTTAGANWNIVNVSGEYLRRKDGLVVKDQLKGQLDYLENCLATQEKKRFTKFGFYADPSSPLAYDAFPRLWLEDAVADGAVEGEWRKRLDDWLTQGALAGLLLISPSGEWPHGGRSAHHQWNEAENCAIAEINAIRWKKAGREDIAGSFKRAAHLCLTSVSRWQRPSGELWIVKNFADPARRHGFEGYSFHSQYNLLPMAMLAIAYLHADDSIPERPIPSESASYVFSFHEGFHHVAAAAGGYYVLIDTAADLHYGSTGLQRIHRAGVELSPITDTPGPSADYGPPEEHPRAAMVTGMEWKGDDGQWHSLGEFGVPPPKNPNPTQPADPGPVTEDVDVEVKDQTKDRIAFLVRYHTAGQGARTVEEHYVISKSGLEGTQRITGSAPSATRVVFPALVHDGARPTDVQIDGATVRIKRAGALTRDLTSENKDWLTKPGGSMSWTLQSPPGVELSLNGPQIVTHNGYVQAVRGELPTGTREIKWKLTLE